MFNVHFNEKIWKPTSLSRLISRQHVIVDCCLIHEKSVMHSHKIIIYYYTWMIYNNEFFQCSNTWRSICIHITNALVHRTSYQINGCEFKAIIRRILSKSIPSMKTCRLHNIGKGEIAFLTNLVRRLGNRRKARNWWKSNLMIDIRGRRSFTQHQCVIYTL